jgi:tetratricopeptide (TPR) repeat protein
MKLSLKLRSGALCERICAESSKAAATDAQHALHLAGLALKVATLARGGEAWRSRLQGYTWAFVGNARRVANDLIGADEAFATSTKLWKAGQPEDDRILDESRILYLEASLRRDQRRWPEALALLDQAQAVASSEDARARLLLNKACTLEQMGRYQSAVRILHQIQDIQVEPRLLFGTCFNLAVNYCHLGKYKSAVALVPKVRRLAMELGNDLDLIRTTWLEGRIAAGSGKKLEAIPVLERARVAFADRGLGCDMALVNLDLAILYLEDGHTLKVQELAREAFVLLRCQGIMREMLAAFRLFCASGPVRIGPLDR